MTRQQTPTDRMNQLAKRQENKRLRASLERMLLEYDFMIEAGLIPDTRDDVIFVEARAALEEKTYD